MSDSTPPLSARTCAPISVVLTSGGSSALRASTPGSWRGWSSHLPYLHQAVLSLYWATIGCTIGDGYLNDCGWAFGCGRGEFRGDGGDFRCRCQEIPSSGGGMSTTTVAPTTWVSSSSLGIATLPEAAIVSFSICNKLHCFIDVDWGMEIGSWGFDTRLGSFRPVLWCFLLHLRWQWLVSGGLHTRVAYFRSVD